MDAKAVSVLYVATTVNGWMEQNNRSRSVVVHLHACCIHVVVLIGEEENENKLANKKAKQVTYVCMLVSVSV